MLKSRYHTMENSDVASTVLYCTVLFCTDCTTILLTSNTFIKRGATTINNPKCDESMKLTALQKSKQLY